MRRMSDRIRVGFDAYYFEQPMTGSGQYAGNIWRELQQAVGPENAYLLAPANIAAKLDAEGAGQVVAANVPGLPSRLAKVWWEQVGLPQAAAGADIDLVHIPYFTAPVRKTHPVIVTIHDVIPLVLPGYARSAAMRAYLKLNSKTVRRADLILTDSEYSRGDIHRELDIPLERIRTIPLAAGPEYHPSRSEEDEAGIQRIRDRYELERPFVLHVGGFDRRKRIPDIIAAFALANAQVGDRYDLVIAGNPHTGNQYLYPPVDAEIRRWGIQDRVRLTGFVPGEVMPDLYRAAEIFVFGSEYEGFGLDPLEALATGLPVVCSNRTSLPEVVGDVGILVDPDVRSLGEGLVQVMSDEVLRGDLSARAIEHASHFSWKRTAEKTFEAYRDVLRQHGEAT